MGKFIEYASNRDGVVRAKVKSYGPRLSHGKTLYESMVVEIMEVVKGKYAQEELTFLGDPGNLCRGYVDSLKFKIGSEHFFSLTNKNVTQPLGGCGESSLPIKGDLIEGNELVGNTYKPYTMRVIDLIKSLKAKK